MRVRCEKRGTSTQTTGSGRQVLNKEAAAAKLAKQKEAVAAKKAAVAAKKAEVAQNYAGALGVSASVQVKGACHRTNNTNIHIYNSSCVDNQRT